MTNRTGWMSCAIGLLTILGATSAAAENNDCPQMENILTELRQIRSLLARGAEPTQPATRVTVDTKNAPALGSKEAPITMVEFTNYGCVYCMRFQNATFPDLKKHYIDSGKVRFIVMNLFPDSEGPTLAAQAAACAAQQDKFWAMHELLQRGSQELGIPTFIDYAAKIGMDTAKFRHCIESGKQREAVQQHVHEAAAKGLTGTPVFVIGKATPTGVEGEVVLGAMPFGVFEQKLNALLTPSDGSKR